MDFHILQQIVQAGIHAPSRNNAQPLRYVWADPHLKIYDIPERGHGIFNIGNKTTWLTVGAAMKNMNLVSKVYGYRVSYQIHAQDSDNLLATVQFNQATHVNEPLKAFIGKRVTNRRPYEKKKLTAQQKNDLIQSLALPDRNKVLLIDDDMMIRELVEAASYADTMGIFSPKFHDDHFKFIRWSKPELSKTRDGVPVNSLELSILDKISLFMFRSWRWVSLGLKMGFQKSFQQRTKATYQKSGCVGMLILNDTDPQSLTQAGDMVQTLWLKATEMRLSFQGMMGFPLAVLHCQNDEGLKNIDPYFRNGILKSHQRIKEIFPNLEKQKLVFMFRVGYASSPSERSLRRKIDNVLHVEN